MNNIGLDAPARAKSVEKLATLLANEYLLYTKTLKCHWNVEGKHFGALHLFFKEQYEALFVVVDDVAERSRSLGVMALGTMIEFSKHATLKEHPAENPGDLAMIAWLLDDHEAIIRDLRKYIDATAATDTGTSNFFTDLMEKHEKMAWMLRAHLAK